MTSGLLNINKPKGITSHDVVKRVRKLSGQRRVGHTGTLDPMATGVLLVCLGQATRLIEYLLSGRKHYRATIRFGLTTSTLDAEGEIIRQTDPSTLTEARLREILPAFLGEIQQVPPIFSAIKRAGQPLYKLARAGEAIELPPRPVTIYTLTWHTWQPPDLTLEISCSAGTYIRALARDLGEAAGTGACLIELVRIANANWSLDQSVSLETLEREAQAGSSGWQKYLQPIAQILNHLPKVVLDEVAAAHVRYGRLVKIIPTTIIPVGATPTETPLLRAYTTNGEFLAILALADAAEGTWQPKKVFN
jgi:tRNA pseudouridine55 synthase